MKIFDEREQRVPVFTKSYIFDEREQRVRCSQKLNGKRFSMGKPIVNRLLNQIYKEGGQIVSRGLCLSGSWYNDHSQHLQHPEPSGSFSQDFNLPIQAMMNPVVF